MNENIQKGENLSEAPPFKKSFHFILYNSVKRIFDFLLALFALIPAGIPMAFIALLIKLTSRGPALFRQIRIGKNGVKFYCYKFRSMYIDAPASCATSELSCADSYITPIGAILRKTSLDELPQLINILKGEMSFIGPRPLIPEEEYIHSERKRLGVYNLRPGISGLAQINGRDLVRPAEKVRLDFEYLTDFGFKEDVKILFRTVYNVIGAKDIHEGELEDD